MTGPSVLEYQAAQSTKNSWEYPSTRLKNYRQNKMEQQPPPHEINEIGSFAKAKACHLPILDLRVGGREGSLNFPFLVQVFNLCTAASSPQTKSGRETIFCGGGAAVHRLNQGRNRLIKVKQAQAVHVDNVIVIFLAVNITLRYNKIPTLFRFPWPQIVWLVTPGSVTKEMTFFH